MHAGFGSSSSKKRSKNYSAPVTFVSGGVKHGNKIEGEVCLFQKNFCSSDFSKFICIKLISKLFLIFRNTCFHYTVKSQWHLGLYMKVRAILVTYIW